MIARSAFAEATAPTSRTIAPRNTAFARVLLSVRDASEDVLAGFGSTQLAVRTLDRCSCAVHEGELLLLTGGVASGARSLLRAMQGQAPRRHVRLEVHRRVDAGVQIRRGVVPQAALESIVQGWQHVTEETERAGAAVRAARTVERRVVYLLRVRASFRQEAGGRAAGRQAAATHADWAPWAAALRQANGAIVLACDRACDAWPGEKHTRRATVSGGAPLEVVRESLMERRCYERSAEDPPRERCACSGVRMVGFAAGRIVSESAVLRGSTGGSDAARSPRACCRCSTASPAP